MLYNTHLYHQDHCPHIRVCHLNVAVVTLISQIQFCCQKLSVSDVVKTKTPTSVSNCFLEPSDLKSKLSLLFSYRLRYSKPLGCHSTCPTLCSANTASGISRSRSPWPPRWTPPPLLLARNPTAWLFLITAM